MKDINQQANDYVNESLKEGGKGIDQEDIKKVIDNEDKVHSKINEKSPLDRFLTDIKLFFGLLKDYYHGNYRSLPYKTIASIVTALLYIINPIDIIPDALPFLGQIDDALVLGLCLKLVESDLQNYQDWKYKRTQNV
ncbi:MAG: hypothetical protein CR966_00550 [Pseudomonadales bacterium]|nr:MAG: hypothetical protein CR966_00550 [Pseudomonadales bacterium]